MTKANILVIDDDANFIDLTQFHLRQQGFEVASAENGADGLKQLNSDRFDVVLTDLRLPDADGIDLVRQFKESAPDTEVIVVTGFSSITKAVEATRAGAYNFVEKPVNYDKLLLMIEKAIERRAQNDEIKRLRGKLTERQSYYNIIGSSKAMQNIYEIIDSVAESDANVLIIGESGTGKELVANAIHYNSLRAKKPFVKINCAALPKELIESELFGHVKGAFTGANKDKLGLIGQADGGSLLMDEIGEMPIELQPKLLRVLQERAYLPVGSEKNRDVNFRLICATNRDPLAAVREGLLREDLYYRINTIPILVPPLREREEDILHLAEHFVRVFAKEYNRPVHRISNAAYELLFRHSWPGNVRELQNAIERAVLMSKIDTIEPDMLPLASIIPSRPVDQPVQTTPQVQQVSNGQAFNRDPSFDDLCHMLVDRLSDEWTADTGAEDCQHNIFERLEGSIVQAALERTQGNKQAAATLLGVYRPRLYSIIKKHNLVEFAPSE